MESSFPESTHEDILAEIELDLDRRARVEIPGVGVSRAEPITDPNSGEEFRAGFRLSNGFQMTEAELGSGTTELSAGLELHLSGSHAHFAHLI